MQVKIQEITHGSIEYELEVKLRSKILREPLGLRFTDKELAKENDDIHLGAFVDEKLLGCLSLRFISNATIKMRQVAVDANVQGLGIGRRLVGACEAKARALGFSDIELNARESAMPFYLNLGYEAFGEPFIEVTLPHRKMRKHLKQN